MDVESEYSESSSVTFEWTLRGLKNLFDSTQGDKKSKVTKSIRFCNNKWQILFYANSGPVKDGPAGECISLFLSCEPTPEEKEVALGECGRWVREGVYRFSFELRNLAKTITHSSKEAHNHTFTYKTANWGWAQFARRDAAFYNTSAVKSQDAFVITCTITSLPATPHPTTIPRQPVPKELLDTIGELLDDPLYSDVQFVILRNGQRTKIPRTIWASRRLLRRAEYFESMFSSNFIEGATEIIDINRTPKTATQSIGTPSTVDTPLVDGFEDSDDEDDEDWVERPSSAAGSYFMVDPSVHAQQLSLLLDSTSADSDTEKQECESSGNALASTDDEIIPTPQNILPDHHHDNSFVPKLRIEVRDVAYTTYRSMLYYLYTDNVVFAPLSSSFHSTTTDPSATPLDTTPPTPSEGSQAPSARGSSMPDSSASRAEWIRDWVKQNPGRPAPCSAKSMYRIADRLGLMDLKERAAQHIIKSLTVENIAYETFSPFAATFEAIRKTEVNFFLNHWQEIRASDAMKTVWVQIRNGRHPGFEEVWPLIAQSLEFKPSLSAASSGSKMQT